MNAIGTPITYRSAIRSAIDECLEEDESVVMLGEDIASHGGVFKCTEGLLHKYGPKRIVNTPISEVGFTGVALGMALCGQRPIVEIMFADFLAVAASPLALDIPRWRLMSGGQMKVPVTIRTVGGLGGHFGAQHSMTYESWMQGMPGLAIAAPARPSSAYATIKSAVKGDNPVLIVEHKMLYQREERIPAGTGASSGHRGAHVVRQGRDVTIVASLAAVWTSLDAADDLARCGVSSEVIDITWIKPLDVDAVFRSVSKTGHLIIVLEDYFAGSWAATLVSRLALSGAGLRKPPRVLHLPDDLPVAFSPSVEMAMVPKKEQIVAVAQDLKGDPR